MIEIEKRSLINKIKYEDLLNFFDNNAKFIKKFKRYTIICIERSDFVADESATDDIRIRTDGKNGLFTLKTGNWHSGEARNEYEIHFKLEEIIDAIGIMINLGTKYCVSVYIERKEYQYLDYTVSVDKYFLNDDYIIDFEKLVTDGNNEGIEKIEDEIVKDMNKLGLDIIKSQEMVDFINKINSIQKAQHDFTKINVEDWYKEWEDYIYCRI